MHQKSIQDFSWKIIWVMQTQTEGYHWYTEGGGSGWKDVNDLTQDKTQW